jgi:hypothetical protein
MHLFLAQWSVRLQTHVMVMVKSMRWLHSSPCGGCVLVHVKVCLVHVVIKSSSSVYYGLVFICWSSN